MVEFLKWILIPDVIIITIIIIYLFTLRHGMKLAYLRISILGSNPLRHMMCFEILTVHLTNAEEYIIRNVVVKIKIMRIHLLPV